MDIAFRFDTGYVPVMPYIQLSSCNEGQEDLSLQCVGIGKGRLSPLIQKYFDFFQTFIDDIPGTVPQPCDIGLPVSVHNEQGQQFQIVLRQFAGGSAEVAPDRFLCLIH